MDILKNSGEPIPLNYQWSFLIGFLFGVTFDDSYFVKHRNKYQGVPINGYTKLIQNILDRHNIYVEYDSSYILSDYRNHMFKHLIYTGPLDTLFLNCYGELPYRSLRFESQYLKDWEDYQGTAQINYTSEHIPYTRITEHKHFMLDKAPKMGTIITKEYPDNNGPPLYPINNEINNAVHSKYVKLFNDCLGENNFFGGRLADYRYYDMDQTIEKAMIDAENILQHTNL
jgi:UDP-galactopyranose mutase